VAKKADARVIIHLACSQCKERTYTTTKNRKNDANRLELKKYCPRCRAHTPHKETK
jgi:large subunit ribosomal protein L33